jgi:hypothetical protein
MSRLKNAAPPRVAPKDDLIESLLESESEGDAALKNSQTNTATVSRLSAIRHSPPPPPPPTANNSDEAVFNFESGNPSRAKFEIQSSEDDQAYNQTLSVVSRGESPSVPKFELEPEGEGASLSVEDAKTRVSHVADRDDDSIESTNRNERSVSLSEETPVQTAAGSPEEERERVERSIRLRTADLFDDPVTASREVEGELEDEPTKPLDNVAPRVTSEQKPKESKDRLQKLEDVLKRLTPGFDKKKDRPKVESKSEHRPEVKPVIESVQPPPVKPPGVVSKAKLPDSTPTPGIKADELSSSQAERAPTVPVSSDDDKTIAAAQTPSPVYVSSESEGVRPIWQDAKTEMISRMTSADNPDADPESEQFMPTEIRPNSPGARFREQSRQAQPGAAIFSSAEAALRQSENLRVAQKRISDLEGELERVRRENESLRSAGETLRRRMDELQANSEAAELNTQEAKKIAEEERKVLRGQISSRDREIAELKSRIDDAESRLESNFRKIRVRERDLEHRIEIIKAESQSIAASKDRMILDLKRQIDQISSELNHAKAQVQETFAQFKERQETARRAVRALRIALTVLEGEEDSGSRKAE